TDVTLTYGTAVGIYENDVPSHDAGDLRIDPTTSGQVSVTRPEDVADGRVLVRRLRPGPDGWREELAWIAADGSSAAVAADGTPPTDPTRHPTFTTPSRAEFRGRALWSDLAFFEADAALPEERRRRVVSVQKALWSATGAFVGVVRVALASTRLDELVRI